MDYRRVRISDILKMSPGKNATAYGWVKTRRDSKGVSFVQLSDGSSFQDLQVVIPEGAVEDEALKSITTGACVAFTGPIVESPAAGQPTELRAEKAEVFGPADPNEYPLQKKGASFEFLREIAHLRARGNTFGAVFRVRSEASFATHKFFHDRGFTYIHTPIITASDAEGAGQLFSVSTALELIEKRFRLKTQEPTEDFFGKAAFLTVSGQLEAEALALGLTNVYTFGPTFRAENSNTPRHLAEFWMIEPEMAFCSNEGNMNLAEEYLRYLIQSMLETCSADLEFFNQRIEPELFKTLEHVASSDFERLTYTDAIKLLESSGEKFEFPVFWGSDLQSEHERWLTEKKVGKPVILSDYPKEIKAFYMRLNDDQKTVAAMDVLVPRIGEIIGGSQREERHDVLKSRVKEAGLSAEAYKWYFDLRRFGSSPHAGFGLGLERFLMYVTGMKNIRDVIPFHRTPGHAEF
jgi:asparaginyl-tRNA synthetase